MSRSYNVQLIGHLRGDGAGLLMIDMRWHSRDFSLLLQPKSRLHQNLWRLKLGLPSSLGASRGCDCCKSRSRGGASCMLPLPGVHGPHPQAATAAEWRPEARSMLCSLDGVSEAEQEASVSRHLRLQGRSVTRSEDHVAPQTLQRQR